MFLLVLLSIAVTLAAPDGRATIAVTIAIQGLTLITALWTSDMPHRVVRTATIIVIVALAASLLALLSGRGGSTDGVRLIQVLLVALVPASMLRGMRTLVRTQGVTGQVILGALTIYLLIGMMFAILDASASGLMNESFFSQGGNRDQASYVYFSFTTISTVGFGDLTPIPGLPRALTILECVLGQIYLVTVVSLAVGGYARGRRGGGQETSTE